MTRVAVIGHVEWVTHARGELPARGEIAVLADAFDEPAGGGAVSASQVAKLGAECLFFTALGRGEEAERAEATLGEIGVRVLAARRDVPQPRALSVTGSSWDRTILVMTPALAPILDDPLPWEELSTCDAVYFTGNDPGTLVAARGARQVVVTARRLPALLASGVRPDVLLASAADPGEGVDGLAPALRPRVTVLTEGARGGRYLEDGLPEGRYAPAPPPGPPVDSYGSGDSFAAGLSVGLGRGLALSEALALGARCGAVNLTARGGLGGQLREPVP